MKKTDFTKKSEKELGVILKEKSLALSAFRFGIAGSKTRNVKEGSLIKKDIARIKTILNVRGALADTYASGNPEAKTKTVK